MITKMELRLHGALVVFATIVLLVALQFGH
jgi:hypothetical protein